MPTFADIIAHDPIPLDRAVLLIAQEVAYKALDMSPWLATLDSWAQTLTARAQTDDSRRTTIQRLNEFLFEELDFKGNVDDYYNPANSFLNDVMRRRTGIPISLSVLYIALGERLGLPVYGIGLPGHFIVGCEMDDEPLYIDPFHQGIILTQEECERIAMLHLPPGMDFSDAFLSPQTPRMILVRILNNLRQIYVTRNDMAKLLEVLNLQFALLPDNPESQRDIGILYVHFERWGAAARHLRAYLYQRPKADDHELIQQVYQEAGQKWSRMN